MVEQKSTRLQGYSATEQLIFAEMNFRRTLKATFYGANMQSTFPSYARAQRRVGLVGLLGASLLATLGLSVTAPAQAQAYPNKPLRIVVPYPAGGGTDVIARMVGAKLSESWGQPVIIENKAGASGILGNDAVAKAAPDGYTVLMGITTLVQMPHLNNKLPYDVFKDFTPILQLALSANLFAVPANSPAKTLKEYISLAKADPAKYNYGSFGAGTTSHLHGELFNMQAGTKLAHVPYKGGAPLATDLMGGQVTAGFLDVTSARAHLNSGRMRFLAISGTKRYANLPNVPTFAEEGLKDFEAAGWFGMFLPANAPRDVVTKLSNEIYRISRLPDVRAKIVDIGLQTVDSGPEVFARTMRSDYAIWGKIVKAADIKLD
jgi:tripartite-type tricarboxylate transporter receptor subunit TctC